MKITDQVIECEDCGQRFVAENYNPKRVYACPYCEEREAREKQAKRDIFRKSLGVGIATLRRKEIKFGAVGVCVVVILGWMLASNAVPSIESPAGDFYGEQPPYWTEESGVREWGVADYVQMMDSITKDCYRMVDIMSGAGVLKRSRKEYYEMCNNLRVLAKADNLTLEESKKIRGDSVKISDELRNAVPAWERVNPNPPDDQEMPGMLGVTYGQWRAIGELDKQLARQAANEISSLVSEIDEITADAWNKQKICETYFNSFNYSVAATYRYGRINALRTRTEESDSKGKLEKIKQQAIGLRAEVQRDFDGIR